MIRRYPIKRKTKHRPASERKVMKAVRDSHPLCEACRMKPSTQAHHIVTEGSGGPTEEWNLMALCLGCHQPGFHDQGWKTFCAAWPHLAGKITAARIRCGRKTT